MPGIATLGKLFFQVFLKDLAGEAASTEKEADEMNKPMGHRRLSGG
jgi:hypothetical protein